MKVLKLLGIVVLIMTMLINVKHVRAQQISQDPLYRLVFQDNFDSTGLDTNKWFSGWHWWGPNGANGNDEVNCKDTNHNNYYSRRWPNDNINRFFAYF